MQAKRVNIYDAKAQLSKLVAGTEKDGQMVVIMPQRQTCCPTDSLSRNLRPS